MYCINPFGQDRFNEIIFSKVICIRKKPLNLKYILVKENGLTRWK